MTELYSEELVQVLNSSGVVVMPTDTVYGVVCSLKNHSAVERLYKIKQRPLTKAVGTILIADTNQLEGIVTIQDFSKIETYWPGPVSIILPVDNAYQYAHRGHGSLAFRIPRDAALQALLKKTGPLATSSANLAGHPTVSSIEEAKTIFADQIDLYVDGGEIKNAQPSKIIKIKQDGSEEIIRS